MNPFFLGLFLLSAGTLMYEVLLTRLLSVVSWYYLAFVSVSMAMFGMTAGALAVQLRPALFDGPQVPRRLTQASFLMAAAMPFTLMTLLAVPVEISYSAQTLYSFALFTTVIAVPFFFSGVGVCLALTRTPYPTGRVYAVDLAGAAAGCLVAVGLMNAMDAPSAVLAVSGMLFIATAGFANHAGEPGRQKKCLVYALIVLALAAINSSTRYGIQPIWAKGKIDTRSDMLAEYWNPISKVRLYPPRMALPYMWGPSPRMPKTPVNYILLDIDNDAATPLYRFEGNPNELNFLLYDVTSLGVQLRRGGTAAVIGMGGGRDVFAAMTQGFRRIVGIEVNSTIVNVGLHWYGWFSGLAKVPGLEVHEDEGRSYLTRTNEMFDVIQASMVDTWAAASAGAMTLSENSLYTVDAWRIFYRHLKPGGVVTFSRWGGGAEAAQTLRMFSLAWATLLSEGAADPARHIALIGSDRVATLLMCNRPFSAEDLSRLRALVDTLEFNILYLPGDPIRFVEISTIVSARTPEDLARLRDGPMDYSPTYDSSPFFFNSLRLRRIPALLRTLPVVGNLRALAFMLCFLFAALLLLAAAIIVPLIRASRLHRRNPSALTGGIVYFVAIGLGFLFVEIAMMQELSVFLGQPIYSLAVVLAGLIFSSGMGSLASERLRALSRVSSRLPALAAGAVICGYAVVAFPFIHEYASRFLWQRVTLSLVLVAPCGFMMGFCFPVGLRWMKILGHEESLPWMWALNGAASVTASFFAIIVAMEVSLTAAVLLGAACYALGAILLPWKSQTGGGEIPGKTEEEAKPNSKPRARELA